MSNSTISVHSVAAYHSTTSSDGTVALRTRSLRLTKNTRAQRGDTSGTSKCSCIANLNGRFIARRDNTFNVKSRAHIIALSAGGAPGVTSTIEKAMAVPTKAVPTKGFGVIMHFSGSTFVNGRSCGPRVISLKLRIHSKATGNRRMTQNTFQCACSSDGFLRQTVAIRADNDTLILKG